MFIVYINIRLIKTLINILYKRQFILQQRTRFNDVIASPTANQIVDSHRLFWCHLYYATSRGSV